MANRFERDSKIAGEGPYVRPFADDRLAIGVVPIGHGDQSQRGDLHGAAGQNGRHGSPGKGIGAPPIYLDRGIDRRRLPNSTGEARQHGLDFRATRPRSGFADDRTFTVVGVASDTPTDTESVVLPVAHRISDGLGRLAERQRQNAGCEGVERACMSDFASDSAADQLHDPIGADPARLVDHQPAVDDTISLHRRHF